MSKINYASMVYARVMIVSHSAVPLAKAVAIATKYNTVQRWTCYSEKYINYKYYSIIHLIIIIIV